VTNRQEWKTPETQFRVPASAETVSVPVQLDRGGALPAIPGVRRLLLLREEVRSKLGQAHALENRPPEQYGFDFDAAVRCHVLMAMLFRRYFRARCEGIELLPPSPLMLVANHGSHVLSWDGSNILSACVLEATPPRLIHPMAEHRLMELPILGRAARTIGAIDGNREACIELLRSGSSVLTFPEGAKALTKPFRRRYQLVEFGEGFMHVAMTTGVPIVPVAVIGSEEEAPLLFNARRLARIVRTPVAPITPTIVVPLPVRYRLYFGTPLYFDGSATPSRIREGVNRVRSSIESLIRRGLKQRGDRYPIPYLDPNP
jgi:1-acyl-sn-glycerol-3-phosphate acyltransferase